MTREEAIRRIKAWNLDSDDMEVLAVIIPELLESEDERIRKWLISYIGNCPNQNFEFYGSVGKDAVLAWLEKQKEQKPAEWSEIEVEFRGEKVKVKRPFFRDDKGHGYSTTEQDDWVTWDALRAWAESHGYTPFDLYPRAEWSEEDEKMLNDILGILHSTEDAALANFSEQKKWLKSLRPSWRPSEEQIYSLGTVVKGYNEYAVGSVGYRLKELYEQLKKL